MALALLCGGMVASTGQSPAVGGGLGRPAAAAPDLASVRGTVTDTAGEAIAGASVEARTGDGLRSMTSSDEAGRFGFAGLTPGSWTFTVRQQGFASVTHTAVVRAGAPTVLEPFALPLATVSVDVEVTLPRHDLELEQIHEEEQQRLLGILPNFFVSYNQHAVALTAGQKYALSWANVRDPGNLLLVGTLAGVQQATDAFPGYGQGAAGYGRRYGANLGNLVAGTFLGGAVLPSLFRQDPRYFYRGTGSRRSRFLYAVSSAVVCRGDNGHRQPAFAGVLGDLSAGALSNAYYPASDRHGVGLTLENGFLGVAGDALNGVFQEFFSRTFTRSPHAP